MTVLLGSGLTPAAGALSPPPAPGEVGSLPPPPPPPHALRANKNTDKTAAWRSDSLGEVIFVVIVSVSTLVKHVGQADKEKSCSSGKPVLAAGVQVIPLP